MRIRTYIKYSKPFYYLCGFYLLINTLLRLILIADPVLRGSMGVIDYFHSLVIGLVPNLLMFCILAIPLWLQLLVISDRKLNKPYGQIILTLLGLLLGYLLICDNAIKAYGSVLIYIVGIFIFLKVIIFAWLLWQPAYRIRTRKWLYGLILFIYVAMILLNALSEYFFWKEFGVRYNFIAVDYLIYTNEVIGNIMQSYPVVPLFSLLGLVAALVTVLIYRRTNCYFAPLPILKTKGWLWLGAGLSILMACWLLPSYQRANTNPKGNANLYVSELSADGLYKFYSAFMDNNLSYSKFYATMPLKAAVALLSGSGKWNRDGLEKTVLDTAPELHKNIILITVESLSASYLAHYGNKDRLTPFLDSLADQGLFFTQLYAAGNRTVRGLEALTLCIPPSPGESIIKRKDNKEKFTTGNLLRQRGYSVQFLYGGYSYFDNMQDFFEGNDYQVIDRDNFQPSEISFANIWGVCDEDMADKMMLVLNKDYRSGKPFFAHWMTVSNHRPFTYPEGKISISGTAKSRKGGVMYTDYALRHFFSEAQKQPWFNNTVFIIVADHCASSSGKVSLPVDGYRIPCIIYSPHFIKPQKINTLMSQIDVMPTLFALLHFSYRSKFIGENVLDSSYQPRAFMATYQDLGYLKDSILTVLSPVREVHQYYIQNQKNRAGLSEDYSGKFVGGALKRMNAPLEKKAISYYQTTAWLLQHKKFQRLPSNIDTTLKH